MANFNKVIIIGNITRDIELRQTPNGAMVLDNSLAINNTRIVNEQKVEETTFVDFVVWNKNAELLSQYQHKGSNILIEGRLDQDVWDDPTTGKKRSRLKVVADRIQFLDAKPKTDTYASPQQAYGDPQQPAEPVYVNPQQPAQPAYVPPQLELGPSGMPVPQNPTNPPALVQQAQETFNPPANVDKEIPF